MNGPWPATDPCILGPRRRPYPWATKNWRRFHVTPSLSSEGMGGMGGGLVGCLLEVMWRCDRGFVGGRGGGRVRFAFRGEQLWISNKPSYLRMSQRRVVNNIHDSRLVGQIFIEALASCLQLSVRLSASLAQCVRVGVWVHTCLIFQLVRQPIAISITTAKMKNEKWKNKNRYTYK